MNRISSIALCAGILAGSMVTAVQGVTYTVHELPSPGAESSMARGLNNGGQIVGTIEYPGSGRSATLWQDKTSAPLTIPGDTVPGDINEQGHVVGWYSVNMQPAHAFLWHADTGLVDIGTLGGYHAVARAVNDSIEVVGYSELVDRWSGFLWSEQGGTTYLGTLGGTHSEAWDINNAGEIVGCALTADGSSRAVLWDAAGEVTDLGTLGGSWSGANAVNNVGQVVGLSGIDDSTSGAFLWTPDGGMVTIFEFPTAFTVVEIGGINDSGMVVGSMRDDSGGPSMTQAFVWSEGSGLTILGDGVACGVNDAGQIAGMMFGLQSGYGAVVWEPVAEPSSLASLALGLMPLAAAIRKRRSA